ncbi:MAG: DNA-formamidopyrimidine glycosylase [Anaerolineae bacterium]|jgi:formamidopyrimidine-DNA glycosylase
MPELPEVETVARGLRDSLLGRTITGVTVGWPRTIARLTVAEFTERVAGQRIALIGRRGKYVIIELSAGYLLIHLKMSGRLCVVPMDEPSDRHVHVLFDLDDGRQLRFRDVRKFGRIYLVDEPSEITAGLGPEPLADDFTVEDFSRLLARRRGRLKPLLLNQRFLAGLGNIYADEALFAARLHPMRKADSLTDDEQARLYGAIRTVLKQAVVSRGTTLSDGGYTDASGRAGGYQDRIAVYGRGGEPCPRCRIPIERIVIGGRSAHFCPHCQVEGRSAC